MRSPVRRGEIASAIQKLINLNGATHITMTLTVEAAQELSSDLRWACKTTMRSYEVEKIAGEIRTCEKSRNK